MSMKFVILLTAYLKGRLYKPIELQLRVDLPFSTKNALYKENFCFNVVLNQVLAVQKRCI